jgi:hypothetical protein
LLLNNSIFPVGYSIFVLPAFRHWARDSYAAALQYAVFNCFWPFFAGIVVHLIAAVLQFMRLVLLPPANQPAA